MRRILGLAVALALMAATLAPASVLAAAPANDSFATPALIASLPYNDSVDNTDASIEASEPFVCIGHGQTVWWAYTAPVDQVLRADTTGGNRSDASVLVFEATGPNITDLSFVGCGVLGGATSFTARSGTTYYFQVGTAFGGPGTVALDLAEVAPPANDDFANAAAATALPFSLAFDTTAATIEAGEPTPSCGFLSHTAWFTFTPAISGSYSARLVGPFSNLAVYSGSSLGSLAPVGCQTSPTYLTFQATAGTTYYLQSFGAGLVTFEIDVAPPPVASFSAPSDISIFENAEFGDFSSDPAGVGIATRAWDFGDGGSAGNVCCPLHRYSADGDYIVTLAVTTSDGRQATATRLVSVRTHDVAISKFTVPTSASAGETRQITVALKNQRYPETVNVQLFRSLPGFFGWEPIATTTSFLPVLKGGRTTPIVFSYTFTPADAAVGKVSFRAVATLIGSRDPLLADNEAISSPTKVKR